jgi:hypothetical protein
MTYNTSAEKTALSHNSYIALKALEKMAKGRCWEGYEPVPGKPAYSNDSCRPVGSKKKKKTEKKAFLAWGGGELGLHPKGKGIGGALGYTNLLGLAPIPTGHIDIGGPDYGVRMGVTPDPGSEVGISPLLGVRYNHPRRSGVTRQFPRGLVELIYDKLRGRTKEDAMRASYPELFEEADDEDSYVPPDSDDSDEYFKKIQQAVKGDDRFEVVENDSEKSASSCGSHSKPKKKKSKKIEKVALKIATKVAAYRQIQEKLAALGGLQSSYVADAAGADASERANILASERAQENEDSGLLDDMFGQAADANRMINKRKRHAAAAFAESDAARLLNVVDPSGFLTDNPDMKLTGLAMLAGNKDKDREARVLKQYKDIIKKYQDPVEMDGDKTTRETPWHLLMQGELADADMDVAGHKQQREEHPLNYWLNPVDRTGPISELLDRWHRRMGASVAEPDSALGRFGMGVGNLATLGLLGALTGGEDAQNKLRRSAVANKIYGEESMPRGANKPKDGDGDGKVNDGTSEEKAAASCGSHAASKPKKKKKKLVTKTAQQAALAIAEKVANYRAVVGLKGRESRIKQAKCVLNVYKINQELEKYDLHRLQKSAAVGAHKPERLKAAALIRQRELEKQEFLENFAM